MARAGDKDPEEHEEHDAIAWFTVEELTALEMAYDSYLAPTPDRDECATALPDLLNRLLASSFLGIARAFALAGRQLCGTRAGFPRVIAM